MLRALRDRHDNTVLVIEHDLETIAADWIVDFRPGAGRLGGQIVAEGPPEVVANPASDHGTVTRGNRTSRSPRRAGLPVGRGWSIAVRASTTSSTSLSPPAQAYAHGCHRRHSRTSPRCRYRTPHRAAATARRRGQHRGRRRAQPRPGQVRRLGHRSGPRWRRCRWSHRRCGATSATRGRSTSR